MTDIVHMSNNHIQITAVNKIHQQYVAR